MLAEFESDVVKAKFNQAIIKGKASNAQHVPTPMHA